MRVNANVLNRELRYVAHASDRAPEAHAILKYALWRVRDGGLYLEATDIETTLSAGIEVEDAGPDRELAVPAAASISILGNARDEVLEIDLTEKSWSAKDSFIKARLSGLPTNDWPSAPRVDQESTERFELRSSVVLEALSRVKHATAKGSRYSSGDAVPAVLVLEGDGRVTAAAAHEHRAAVSGSLAALSDKSLRVIKLKIESIPILEAFGELGGDWSIASDSSRAEITSGRRRASILLPEGAFPNVPSVISSLSSLSDSFEADRTELLAAARVASSCPGIEESAVRLDLSDEGLKIIGRGEWSEMTTRCAGTVSGEATSIALTGAYLIDLAESLRVPSVEMRYRTLGTPVLYYRSADQGTPPREEYRVVAGRFDPAVSSREAEVNSRDKSSEELSAEDSEAAE